MATTNNSRLNTEKKATPGCVSTVEILLQDMLSEDKYVNVEEITCLLVWDFLQSN